MNRSEYSEDVAARIDRQVRQILDGCYERAKAILLENRPLLDRLADTLVERETLDGEEFRAIVAEYTEIPEKPLGCQSWPNRIGSEKARVPVWA